MSHISAVCRCLLFAAAYVRSQPAVKAPPSVLASGAVCCTFVVTLPILAVAMMRRIGSSAPRSLPWRLELRGQRPAADTALALLTQQVHISNLPRDVDGRCRRACIRRQVTDHRISQLNAARTDGGR